ncbi:MAG: universal stress protein [Acidimicrobiales bacterium]
MWDRLLLAIDQFESGRAAVDFTALVANRSGADVRVLHVRELPRSMRVPPLETAPDAQFVVDTAVFRLRMAGVGAEGRVCSAHDEDVAGRIVEESAQWGCDAIILGSHRLRGLGRIAGGGVRERVLRLSPLPLIVAPTSQYGGAHRPADSRTGGSSSGAAADR